MLIQHFRFRADHWTRYQNVNERFADAVAGEVVATVAEGRRPMVWVQDYHFALVPALLRLSMPHAFVHQFWHIPFPPTDILQLLPTDVYAGVLRGLLGNDLLEFHTERYAQNFLSCVADSLPDASVDAERMQVTVGEHVTTVGAFPISIDVEQYEGLALAPAAEARAAELRTRYATGERRLGVSVDRIDYTKGIPERLRALDLLWGESPELRGRFTMIVVATPSRSDIPAYDELEHAVVDGVAEINARYASGGWEPIVLIKENVDAALLASIYRAADLCLVSSLQDGMNLVAKEFVACQVEERGVLVLSRFAGAAEEIEGAVLINPFNVDGFAAGIRRALEMPLDERRERMQQMREQLRGSTIFDWLESILSRASELMEARRQEAR
jgi:trehalose 6-phosphate synthase